MKRIGFIAAVVVGSIVGYVWLALWVDGRNQRLYREAEDRHWARAAHLGFAEQYFGQY